MHVKITISWNVTRCSLVDKCTFFGGTVFTSVLKNLFLYSRNSDELLAVWLEFDSRQCKIILFSTAQRPALPPAQPLTEKVPGIVPRRVKLPGREADHSPPNIVEVKNGGGIPPFARPYVFMA
jgi:hypothetical protein